MRAYVPTLQRQEPRRHHRITLVLALLAGLLTAGAHPEGAASVAVPRDLDGASASYSMTWQRPRLLAAAATSGIGALSLEIDGDADIVDAIGASQTAREYRVSAQGLADLTGHRYEAFDGTLAYALDPPTADLVQATIDGEADWTSVTTSRLHQRVTLNVPPDLLDPVDTLLPLLQFIDGLGGRTYHEGERVVAGPGRAMFAEARELEPLLPPQPPRQQPRPGAAEELDRAEALDQGEVLNRAEALNQHEAGPLMALPLDFVLTPAGGIEVSGTVWLVDGASLPVAISVRYLLLEGALELGSLELAATASSEGGPLPPGDGIAWPAGHPDAERAAPLATGTRAPSWALQPTVEEVLAAADQTPTLQAYRQQYPDVFLALSTLATSSKQAAWLGAASSDAADVINQELGFPLWLLRFYSAADPGIYVLVGVQRDRVTGEWVGVAQLQGGFMPTTRPDETLTSSSVVDLAERALPAVAEDGSSGVDVLYLAAFDVWAIQRGPGLNAASAASDPTALHDHLYFFLPFVCAAFPPQPGASVLLDGAGRALQTSEISYVAPRVAGPSEAAECAAGLAGLSAADPLDPALLPGLLTDVDQRVQQVTTYTDGESTPHAPILIESNASFDAPSSVSGVVGGTGTRDDPYVIAGWNLRSDSFDVPAITLRGTDRHVVIRDSVLHGDGVGVWIERAANVRVEDNRFLGLGAGVAILGLKDSRIVDNDVAGTVEAIHVQNHIAVDPATAQVTSTPVTDVDISGNRADRTEVGIAYFGTYGTLRDNRIADNTVSRSTFGIFGQLATDTVFEDNQLSANRYGIYLQGGGDGVEVRGGVYADSDDIGLALVAAHGVAVDGGRIEDGGFGVLATRGTQASVEAITVDGNDRGVVGLFSSDVAVTASTFTGNGSFGAYTYDSALDVRGTWWGAPDGPRGCAPGSGDRTSCGVVYAPFRIVP